MNKQFTILNTFIFLYIFVSLFFVSRFVFYTGNFKFLAVSWAPVLTKIFILVISIFFIQALSYFKKINQFFSLSVFLSLISVLTGNIWPLLLNLIIIVSSLSVGKYLYDVLIIKNDSKNILDFILIGIGLIGTFVGLIAHTKYNFPGTYGIILMLPIFLQRKYISSLFLRFSSRPKEKYKFNFTNMAIQSLLVIYFLYSLMPETGHDALATHLFIPAFISYKHEWGFNPELYVWSVTPMLGDWIYSISYMLGGEVASKLVTFMFICILAYLIEQLTQWAAAKKNIENISSLLFLSTPLVFLECKQAFIDSIWAAFVMASFIKFSSFFFSQKKDILSGSKFFAFYNAFAFQTKAVSFTSQLAIFPLIIYDILTKKSYKKYANFFLYALIATLIIGFIPYYTAYIKTGNPVFPLYNNIFKSIYFPFAAFENAFYPGGLHWDFIYKITFHTHRYLESYDGGVGFTYFVFLLPSVALAYKNYKIIFLAFLAFFLVFFTFQGTAYLRYILPFFALANVIIVASIYSNNIGKYKKKILISILIFLIILNLIFFKSAVHYSQPLELKALISEEGRASFLKKAIPIRSAFEIVNELNTEGKPVLIFGNEAATGLNSDAVYVSWYNPKIVDMLTNANDVSSVLASLKYFNVEFIIIDYGVLPAVLNPLRIRKNIEEASSEVLRVDDNIRIRKVIY